MVVLCKENTDCKPNCHPGILNPFYLSDSHIPPFPHVFSSLQCLYAVTLELKSPTTVENGTEFAWIPHFESSRAFSHPNPFCLLTSMSYLGDISHQYHTSHSCQSYSSWAQQSDLGLQQMIDRDLCSLSGAGQPTKLHPVPQQPAWRDQWDDALHAVQPVSSHTELFLQKANVCLCASGVWPCLFWVLSSAGFLVSKRCDLSRANTTSPL